MFQAKVAYIKPNFKWIKTTNLKKCYFRLPYSDQKGRGTTTGNMYIQNFIFCDPFDFELDNILTSAQRDIMLNFGKIDLRMLKADISWKILE